MRRLWILTLVLFTQCTSNNDTNKDADTSQAFVRNAQSDTATLLSQYWTLKDADHPMDGDIIQKENGIDYMPGIVFIQDGQLMVNPAGKPVGGRFERLGDSISAQLDNGQKVVYIIKTLNPESLRLERKTGNDVSTLYYDATNTWWPNTDTNPFTPANWAWTAKPSKPQTDEEIREKMKDYVRFCQYYIEGYARGDASKISFVGLPNILQYYLGGLSIPSDNDLNKKWTDCFYNQDDAFKGYTMLRHAILMKYDWDKKEQNWIKQTPPVLRALRDSL